MENLLNKLVESEDGKYVWILFADGSESTDYETKEDAIGEILSYFIGGMISEMEFFLFIREIIFESKLEYSSELNLKSIEKYADIIRQKIENPVFNKCNCVKIKEAHGYLYNGDGTKLLPLRFRYQYEAINMISLLCKSGEINEETRDYLNVLIDLSELPLEPKRPSPSDYGFNLN